MATTRAQCNPTKWNIPRPATTVKAHACSRVSFYIGRFIISALVTWLGMRSFLGLLSRFSGCSPYDYACACVDNTSVSIGPLCIAAVLDRPTECKDRNVLYRLARNFDNIDRLNFSTKFEKRNDCII